MYSALSRLETMQAFHPSALVYVVSMMLRLASGNCLRFASNSANHSIGCARLSLPWIYGPSPCRELSAVASSKMNRSQWMVLLATACQSEISVAGWWWLEHDWIIFPYIGNVIIPIDFHIFPRGWNHHQTRSIAIFDALWIQWGPHLIDFAFSWRT